MTYAKGTTVSVEKSQAEIQGMVLKRGGRRFASMLDEDRAVVAFELNGRMLRFDLMLPDRSDKRFTMTAHKSQWARKPRTKEAALSAWEQDCRRLWRSLAAVIKAKFIAIEDGVSTFDREFMAHIVLPGGQTMAEWAVPQIEAAYETGKMPPLLAAGN